MKKQKQNKPYYTKHAYTCLNEVCADKPPYFGEFRKNKPGLHSRPYCGHDYVEWHSYDVNPAGVYLASEWLPKHVFPNSLERQWIGTAHFSKPVSEKSKVFWNYGRIRVAH